MQQNGGSFFGVNGQSNCPENFILQNLRPVMENVPYRPTHGYIIQNREEFLPSWQTTNDIVHVNDVRHKLFHDQAGEPVRDFRSPGTYSTSNHSSQVCGTPLQSVVPRPFPSPFSAWGGNTECSSGLKAFKFTNVDGIRSPFMNYELQNKDITSTGGFDLDSKETFPKFGNTQLFSYINKDNYTSKVPSVRSPGTVFADSHSGIEWRQKSTVLPNVTLYSSAPRNFIYHSNDATCQNHKGLNTQDKNLGTVKPESSSMDTDLPNFIFPNNDSADQNYKGLNTQAKNLVVMNPESSSMDTNLPETCDISAITTGDMVKDQVDSHSELDGWDEVKDEKTLPEVVESLWDGSIQFNSCITASMIALFKSGERIPDVNWSELIEVKGKVRLDAFEKYIQDLPRSRNRGLMVISICWKSGSSQAGLKGMKEVAEKYEKGEKVGLAQLSMGIDLYICPPSDSIITLLTKYGFFKGAVASADHPGSLIGCVVWRKTLFPPPKPDENTALLLSVTEAPPAPTMGPTDPERNPHLNTDTEPSLWSPVEASLPSIPGLISEGKKPAEVCCLPAMAVPISEVKKSEESYCLPAMAEPISDVKKPAEFLCLPAMAGPISEVENPAESCCNPAMAEQNFEVKKPAEFHCLRTTSEQNFDVKKPAEFHCLSAEFHHFSAMPEKKYEGKKPAEFHCHSAMPEHISNVKKSEEFYCFPPIPGPKKPFQFSCLPGIPEPIFKPKKPVEFNFLPAMPEPLFEIKKPAESHRVAHSYDDDLPEYDFTCPNTDGGHEKRVPERSSEFLKRYESPVCFSPVTGTVIHPVRGPAAPISRKRSLFEDDDMPEWQPPLELDLRRNNRPAETAHPSNYPLPVLPGLDLRLSPVNNRGKEQRNFGPLPGDYMH